MNTTSASKLTNDNRLVSAKGRFGYAIPVYDDGFGAPYILRDSMGIQGIVRAQTWEDAYSICEDEFFPEATETIEEIKKQYDFKCEHVKIIKRNGVERDCTNEDYPLQDGEFVRWETRETPSEDGFFDNACFQECFGFRPNGAKTSDTLKHGIYAKDLNGESLEVLTDKLIEELEITLEIQDY